MPGGIEKWLERRRFIRLDLSEDVRAIDNYGSDLGRVERVNAGGLQVRLNALSGTAKYLPGTRMKIRIVEPGDVQNEVEVEVRVCNGQILGLKFLD